MTNIKYWATVTAASVVGAFGSSLLSQPIQPAKSTSCLQNWSNAIQRTWQGTESEASEPAPMARTIPPVDSAQPVSRVETPELPARAFKPNHPLTGMNQADWDAYRHQFDDPSVTNFGGWGK